MSWCRIYKMEITWIWKIKYIENLTCWSQTSGHLCLALKWSIFPEDSAEEGLISWIIASLGPPPDVLRWQFTPSQASSGQAALEVHLETGASVHLERARSCKVLKPFPSCFLDKGKQIHQPRGISFPALVLHFFQNLNQSLNLLLFWQFLAIAYLVALGEEGKKTH